MLFLTGAEILSGNIYDAVCVDVKCNFNLGDAARSRSDAVELKETQLLVIACKFTLALQNVDLNLRLTISRRGENLALLGRDRGVSVDDLRHHAAHGLNTERKRSNVKQQQALNFAAENACLKCGADCNAFVRVDALERLFADELLNRFLNSRNSGGTADHENLVDLTDGEAGVAQCLTNRAHGLLNEVCGELVELCSGEREVKVLRAGRIRRDERQVDGSTRHAGKLDFSLLCRFLNTLHSHLIAGKVDAIGNLEAVDDPIHDALIKVVAAKAVIAGRSQNLLYAVAHLNDGNIERTAAEVINHDLLVVFLIDTVGQCCCRRLVDDTLYIEARDLARVLRRLTLCVREVRRNGDNCARNALAEVSFRVALQLLEDHCGDFLRGVALTVDRHLVVCAHLSLNRGDRAVRVRNRLTLCDLTDHALACLGECHDGRGGSCAFCVCDNDRLAAFNNRYARVCCTKVNTNCLCHINYLPLTQMSV